MRIALLLEAAIILIAAGSCSNDLTGFSAMMGRYDVEFGLPSSYQYGSMSPVWENELGQKGNKYTAYCTDVDEKGYGTNKKSMLLEVRIYNESQTESLDALKEADAISERTPGEYSEYESIYRYNIMEKSDINYRAAAWVNDRTLIKITSLNFDLDEFKCILDSIKLR